MKLYLLNIKVFKVCTVHKKESMCVYIKRLITMKQWNNNNIIYFYIYLIPIIYIYFYTYLIIIIFLIFLIVT